MDISLSGRQGLVKRFLIRLRIRQGSGMSRSA